MKKLEDLILLRAIYNGELSQAIFDKDIYTIIDIVNRRYSDELQDVKVFAIPDIDLLYKEHIKAIEEIDNNPALLQRLL